MGGCVFLESHPRHAPRTIAYYRVMKNSLALILALALAPAPAFAQAGPPPDVAAMPSPNPQALAAMQQSRAQLEALRTQTRTRLLTTLTPAHRAMFANVIGQLALSIQPNATAAATQLDAVLSPAEKQSVLAIEAAQRANAKAIMDQTRAAFEAGLTADQRARMDQHRAQMDAARQSHAGGMTRTPDAGMILLRTLGNIGPAFGHPGPHMDGMRG